MDIDLSLKLPSIDELRKKKQMSLAFFLRYLNITDTIRYTIKLKIRNEIFN